MEVPRDSRLEECIDRFDAANAQDPNLDATGQPKELVYGRRMSEWLAKLDADPPPELQLAVRAQHIRRWQIPRDTYPAGRSGYLRWRRDLGRFHAETAGAIMRDCGIADEFVARVQAIIRKERFKRDPWAQCLEDVACLVFLDHHFEEFAVTQEEGSMVNILRKTWQKMSAAGREAAGRIDYTPGCQALLDRALSAGA